jgi:hypothetical protein
MGMTGAERQARYRERQAAKVTSRIRDLERARDLEAVAWDVAASWQKWAQKAEAALAEERRRPDPDRGRPADRT